MFLCFVSPCGGNIFSLSVQVYVRLWRSTRLPLISSAEMEIQCSLSAPTARLTTAGTCTGCG